jgi:hypothetical protein
MQLIDASSAALLRDVLSWYWRLGGVIVSCSVSWLYPPRRPVVLQRMSG